jgi:YbbR domain-containing protein
VAALARLLQEFLRLSQTVVVTAVGSVRHNFLLAVLAVGLAFVVWMFIVDTEHPTRTGVFPVDISVEPVNMPEGLTLGGPLGDVALRIEADEDLWDELTASDFGATVNLLGAQIGTQDVEVKVEPLGERDSLRIIEVIPTSQPAGAPPGTVRVELKPLVSQVVPVSVEAVGAPPMGYEPSNPSVEPDQVVVSGPEELVSRVAVAVASVDLSGATTDVRQTYSLVPRDDGGFIGAGVTLDPSSVDIEVTVEQERFSRLVVVSPSLQGSPAAGYNVTAVELDPASVTVLGPLELLNVTSFVVTDDIDITGATSDVSRIVNIVGLHQGVSIISGSSTVSVRVHIAAGQGEATFGVAPQWTGLATDLRVVSATSLVEVTLQGELPTLRNVSPDQVTASVDLSGLGAGSHRLEPQVEAPAGLEVADMSPTSVEVVLETAP